MVTATAIRQSPEIASADLTARFLKGLTDVTRVRIMKLLLQEGGLTVGDIVGRLGAQQGRVSSHLACLRWCGFVVSYREGRNVYYTVADPRVRDLIRTAEAIVKDNAERVLSCQTIGQP